MPSRARTTRNLAGVIMGIGGTADRMFRGDPVQGFSAPGGPGVQLVEQVAEVDEALRDVVDEGFRELDERISALEQKSSAGPSGGTMEKE